MMDIQQIFNLGASVIGTAAMWILKVIWDEIKALKEAQDNLQKDMAKEMVLKEDYRADITDIKNMFNRILDKMDTKADK
jgi:esterase/lipase